MPVANDVAETRSRGGRHGFVAGGANIEDARRRRPGEVIPWHMAC